MDDLELLGLCIEMPEDKIVRHQLSTRCKPVLSRMSLDEKVEAQVVKKIGLDAWCDIHHLEGTIARLIYVYLGQVKVKASKTSMSPKDIHRMILAGKSTAYMAKKFGVHRDSVRRAIVKYGYVELYESHKRKSKASKIIALLETNPKATNASIAKQVGTNVGYVAKIRHSSGFTIKTRKPPATYLQTKLAEGLCAKEIASELGLSHRTIQTYLSGYGIRVGDSPAYRGIPAIQLEEMLKRNMPVMDIADILCKAESTIKTYIYQYKLNHLIVKKYEDPELPKKILELREQGIKNTMIASQLGISVSYLCSVVKRNGFPQRRQASKYEYEIYLFDLDNG